MGESVQSRFRRGEISAKAARSWGAPSVLRQTRVEASKMAEFEHKQKDEADVKPRNRGDVAGGNRHIDHRQSMGSPAHAGGAPSRGGGAGAQKQPTRRAHIDDASLQTPKYAGSGFKTGDSDMSGKTGHVRAPARNLSGWKGKKGKGGKGLKTPKRITGGGGNPSNSNQYGDPNNRRYG